MSDAIKKEAQRISMLLTSISRVATGMTKAAEAASEGKQVVVGIPAEMLADIGKTAEDAVRLFAAMGVVDRAEINANIEKKKAGLMEMLGDLSPVIDQIREMINERAGAGGDEEEEECNCLACTMSRDLGGAAVPKDRTVH